MKKPLLISTLILAVGLQADAYRDLETGVFLTKDPLGFEAGPNFYVYVEQNPWTKFDPEGLEPNKDQVGTIDDFTKVMNNTKNKVGQQTGAAASATMKYLGSTKGLPPKPAATAPFNSEKGRYIYTENGGWIDMVHFIFYAGKAYSYKEEGNKNPVGKAVQKGFQQERFDPKHSKYSYEDLPSDKFGAMFGATHFDPMSAKTISEQTKDYINKELKPTDPTTAPNWHSMPQSDSKKAPTATNKTTKPMFIPPLPSAIPAATPLPPPTKDPAPRD